MQPDFLICVAVLALAAGGMSITISYLGVQIIKKNLPLKKPLNLMNKQLLAPYNFIEERKIENTDLLEELGTEEYIEWYLEDTQAPASSPVRYCSLFVTYYTGNPDKVPHVPEECYIGGGNQRLAAKDVTFQIPLLPPSRSSPQSESQESRKVVKERIPVRCLIFGSKRADIWQAGAKYPVLYFFKVNGTYAGNRNQTRAIMGYNIFGKYSYFSKVEWKFYGSEPSGIIYPKEDQAIAASAKLLSVIVPILEKDHWPDWEKAMNEK